MDGKPRLSQDLYFCNHNLYIDKNTSSLQTSRKNHYGWLRIHEREMGMVTYKKGLIERLSQGI
jgi:hypothetical protein